MKFSKCPTDNTTVLALPWSVFFTSIPWVPLASPPEAPETVFSTFRRFYGFHKLRLSPEAIQMQFPKFTLPFEKTDSESGLRKKQLGYLGIGLNIGVREGERERAEEEITLRRKLFELFFSKFKRFYGFHMVPCSPEGIQMSFRKCRRFNGFHMHRRKLFEVFFQHLEDCMVFICFAIRRKLLWLNFSDRFFHNYENTVNIYKIWNLWTA